MITVWYSTEVFADYIIDNTVISEVENVIKKKIMESDANNAKGFHKMPDHIKKILYLDAPDLIVELNGEPIFTIEITREAGTGHNAFQRFLRLLASVENSVPALYIYPEAVQVGRGEKRDINDYKWDRINPSIFKALEKMMRIHDEPALLFYYPSLIGDDSKVHPNKGLLDDINYPSCPLASDSEMIKMFNIINIIVDENINGSGTSTRTKLINKRAIADKRDWMMDEYISKNPTNKEYSPITATKIVKTEKLLDYLSNYGYDINESSMLSEREETVIYFMDAAFRGDPYPGALGAIDYLLCRDGKTFEDRDKNLVMCWGKLEELANSIRVISSKSSVNDFIDKINPVYKNTRKPYKCLLGKNYSEIVNENSVPRYFMQVRYGCTYTKSKEVRGFSYFADAILFPDGAFWREA